MSSEPITIGTLDTKPRHDPYVNIEGVTSRTYLKLDPGSRIVYVEQEYQDNATPMDEWHGLILTWRVNSYPSEADMYAWIEASMAQLQTICDGFERVWNGDNHVGHLTEEARAVSDELEFELDNDAGPANYYEYWSLDAWLEDARSYIQADTTDEQLAAFAQDWEPTSDTVLSGEILPYITKLRDARRAEAGE